jgi:hypothetical protein
MKILYFFLFLWIIFALLDPDPDPDPATQNNAGPCGSGYRSGSEILPVGAGSGNRAVIRIYSPEETEPKEIFTAPQQCLEEDSTERKRLGKRKKNIIELRHIST